VKRAKLRPFLVQRVESNGANSYVPAVVGDVLFVEAANAKAAAKTVAPLTAVAKDRLVVRLRVTSVLSESSISASYLDVADFLVYLSRRVHSVNAIH
jgi:hypothetical protein